MRRSHRVMQLCGHGCPAQAGADPPVPSVVGRAQCPLSRPLFPRLPPSGLTSTWAGTQGDVPHSSAQVWMIGTALAEPKIVSLRHFVSEHRRERSDTLLIAKGEAGGIDEGVTVPRDGARAAAE